MYKQRSQLKHTWCKIEKVFYVATILFSNVFPGDGSLHEPKHVAQ